MITLKSTAPTGVPQSLEAVAVSSSSILITWNPPVEEEQNGVIRMYYINVTELPTGNVRELMAHGDERIKVVNNLHPYYVYECAVAAYTVGLGPAALTQVLTDPAGINSCSKSTCLPIKSHNLFFVQFQQKCLRTWWLWQLMQHMSLSPGTLLRLSTRMVSLASTTSVSLRLAQTLN